MNQRGQLTIETNNKNINHNEASSLNMKAGEYVLLSFTDTGCGFDKETKEKIFDPFVTTKGLNLSFTFLVITKIIVIKK